MHNELQVIGRDGGEGEQRIELIHQHHPTPTPWPFPKPQSGAHSTACDW